jgi:hypothetical protein
MHFVEALYIVSAAIDMIANLELEANEKDRSRQCHFQ